MNSVLDWAVSSVMQLGATQASAAGAIDVVAVKDDRSKTITCSPFHVKLGRYRSSRGYNYTRGDGQPPHHEIVKLRVNGREVGLSMKLGQAGEAFFVQRTAKPKRRLLAGEIAVPTLNESPLNSAGGAHPAGGVAHTHDDSSFAAETDRAAAETSLDERSLSIASPSMRSRSNSDAMDDRTVQSLDLAAVNGDDELEILTSEEVSCPRKEDDAAFTSQLRISDARDDENNDPGHSVSKDLTDGRPLDMLTAACENQHDELPIAGQSGLTTNKSSWIWRWGYLPVRQTSVPFASGARTNRSASDLALLGHADAESGSRMTTEVRGSTREHIMNDRSMADGGTIPFATSAPSLLENSFEDHVTKPNRICRNLGQGAEMDKIEPKKFDPEMQMVIEAVDLNIPALDKADDDHPRTSNITDCMDEFTLVALNPSLDSFAAAMMTAVIRVHDRFRAVSLCGDVLSDLAAAKNGLELEEIVQKADSYVCAELLRRLLYRYRITHRDIISRSRADIMSDPRVVVLIDDFLLPLSAAQLLFEEVKANAQPIMPDQRLVASVVARQQQNVGYVPAWAGRRVSEWNDAIVHSIGLSSQLMNAEDLPISNVATDENNRFSPDFSRWCLLHDGISIEHNSVSSVIERVEVENAIKDQQALNMENVFTPVMPLSADDEQAENGSNGKLTVSNLLKLQPLPPVSPKDFISYRELWNQQKQKLVNFEQCEGGFSSHNTEVSNVETRFHNHRLIDSPAGWASDVDIDEVGHPQQLPSNDDEASCGDYFFHWDPVEGQLARSESIPEVIGATQISTGKHKQPSTDALNFLSLLGTIPDEDTKIIDGEVCVESEVKETANLDHDSEVRHDHIDLEDIDFDEICPEPPGGDFYDSDTDSYLSHAYSLDEGETTLAAGKGQDSCAEKNSGDSADRSHSWTREVSSTSYPHDAEIQFSRQRKLRRYRYRKVLVPSEEQLQLLQLRDGENEIEFELEGCAPLRAQLFVWPADAKIVVTDLEGIVTKKTAVWVSFLGGGSFTSGKSKELDSCIELFHSLHEQGYHILYLTTASSSTTSLLSSKDYLAGIVSSNGLRLPPGPIFKSPDSLVRAFGADRTDVFKAAALRGVRSLFTSVAPRHNPYHACFGTREADLHPLWRFGFPEGRTFVVSEKGDIRSINRNHSMTFSEMSRLLDQIFPQVIDSHSSLKVITKGGGSTAIAAVESDQDSGIGGQQTESSIALPTTIAANKESPSGGVSTALSVIRNLPGNATTATDDSFNDFNFWKLPMQIIDD